MNWLLFVLLFAVAAVGPAAARPGIEHVFVIVMENKDAGPLANDDRNHTHGNSKRAPYINDDLIPSALRALSFIDELPELLSEPHYVLMEAGTNVFADTVIICDAEPMRTCKSGPAQNWTSSPDHLVTQLTSAGLSWMTYAEGIDAKSTGACPVTSHGLYAARHMPFVFFSDVAGAPPAWNAPGCAAHFRELSALQPDLDAGQMANYVFIVPNLCNDMHGAEECKNNRINIGDDFLKDLLPGLIAWSEAHRGIVMLAWDEGRDTPILPFVLAGAGVRKNYASSEAYSHRSMIRTVETIFSLPVLETVKDAADFSDMFQEGSFP